MDTKHSGKTPKPPEPSETRRGNRREGGPLTDVVDDNLNKPLAERIAEELDDRQNGRARYGATDYARGTAEHEDDRET